jgi:hypothetical protein
MTGAEDLLRLRQYSIDSLQSELKKAQDKIEFLEAQLEISKDVNFNRIDR